LIWLRVAATTLVKIRGRFAEQVFSSQGRRLPGH
jgi:hypothetical protein